MDLDFSITNQYNNSYVVYKHTNIINGKVYIGITCQDPKVRWNSGYGYRNNDYFWKAIQKYGWTQGFFHEILYEDLTYEEACKIEIELIAKYNSTHRDYGYNHHQGGRYQDFETRQKISENSSVKRAVFQYSKDGDIIAEYDSKVEASNTTGISVQEICLACSGKILSAGGYFWCNKDEQEKIKIILEKYRSNMEHVLQFDLYGNLICEYNHIYDASDSTGIDRYEIWKVCFDKLQPLDGYLFCYKSKESRIQRWIKDQDKHCDSNTRRTIVTWRSAGPKRRNK